MWAAPFSVAIDDLLVSLRASPSLDPLLRELLDPVRAPVVPPEGTGYALHLADRPNRFHLLFWGGCVVVRTHDATRLVEALLRHLAGHRPAPPGVDRLDAIVLARDGHAVIAPSQLRSRIPQLQRPLARRGVLIADTPWADLDLKTAEVILPGPLLTLGDDIRARLGGEGAESGTTLAATPTRLRAAALAMPAPASIAGPSSPTARALAYMLDSSRSLHSADVDLLPALQQLVRRLALVPIDAQSSTRDLALAIDGALRAAGT